MQHKKNESVAFGMLLN